MGLLRKDFQIDFQVGKTRYGEILEGSLSIYIANKKCLILVKLCKLLDL